MMSPPRVRKERIMEPIYRITSHRISYTVHPQPIGNTGGESKRVDELTLQLESFFMPTATAQHKQLTGRPSAIAHEWKQLKGSIRGIVESEDDTGFIRIEACYLTARCPYCGCIEPLRNDRWSVAVGPNGNPSLKGPYEENVWFADKVHRPLPCPTIDIVPIAHESASVAKPYGEYPSIESFIAREGQMRLFEPEETLLMHRVHGTPNKPYAGIYRCANCNKPYYVEYETGSVSYERKTPLEKRFTPPLLEEIAAINVAVVSDNNTISIRFHPYIGERRNKSIEFNLDDGTTLVDGARLSFDASSSKYELNRIPDDVRCRYLYELVKQLIGEAIGKLSRQFDSSGVEERFSRSSHWPDDNKTLRHIALANRFRGYPDEFYEMLFVWGCPSPIGVLPLHYEECGKTYEKTRLPSYKSLRRIVFTQPLFIPYLMALDDLPFNDPNLLCAMLRHEKAFPILYALRKAGRCAESVFSYLKKTRGELPLWRHLDKIAHNQRLLYGISCGTAHPFSDYLDDKTEKAIRSMRICDAGSTLRRIVLLSRKNQPEDNAKDGPIFKRAYTYTESELKFESMINGYSFTLPKTPLDLIAAGALLNNCLSEYADEIDERTAIVLVHQKKQLVGAIEVSMPDRLIVQARARKNLRIKKESALFETIEEWAGKNVLAVRHEDV